VIGLADLRRLLHRLRPQADLAALDDAAFGEPERDPGALDRVAAVDGHARMAHQEVAHRDAAPFRVGQLRGELCDRFLRQHGRA
jgi:hypothetical protein